MRDTPDIILDSDPTDPEPDFVWQATDGSDQLVHGYFGVTPEGVEITMQTVTAGYGRSVMTQPIPADYLDEFLRRLGAAATEARVIQGYGAR
jgi:hypothetical protein